MSRAAANSLAASGWTLIFPALAADDPEFSPCDGTTRPQTGKPPLGIANKIVATREGADESLPSVAARTARGAAIEVWMRLAGQALDRARPLIAENLGEFETPRAVIESFLEVIAGWSTYETEADYENARGEAEQAVAARKVLRDFRQWTGAPYRKSSLDGQRETILIDRERGKRPDSLKQLTRQLRLAPREHLDGIGLVKRAAGNPEQFVPIARVAVEPWLSAALQYPSLLDEFRRLEVQCKRYAVPHCQLGVTPWLHRDTFRYDGEIFFEGQWPALEKELGLREFCEAYVKPLFRNRLSLPEPHPYVACLCADGDRMGAALGRLNTPDGQSGLSRALAGFSLGVRDIVEKHHGLHVYAGGDDVVAFLPIIHAIPCAEDLRAAFVSAVRPVFRQTDEVAPTLSVGIGVAYYLTPLGKILDLARNAEHYAKNGDRLPEGDQRNALGIIVDKRGGERIKWRAQWKPDLAPGARIERLRDHLVERRMPTTLPYELRDVLKNMDKAENANDRVAGKAWRLEVLRILARKALDAPDRNRKPQDFANEIELMLPAPDDARVDSVREALAGWVYAALVARAFADAQDNIRAVEKRGAELEMGYDD